MKKVFFLYFSVGSGRLVSSALRNLSLNIRLSGRRCFDFDTRRSYKHSTSARRCRSPVSIRSERGKKMPQPKALCHFSSLETREPNGEINTPHLHPAPRGKKNTLPCRRGGAASGRQRRKKSGIKKRDENAQRLK